MFTAVLNSCKSIINQVKAHLKKITKPATATLAVGTITDLPRKKSDLIVENAMLRRLWVTNPPYRAGSRVYIRKKRRFFTYLHFPYSSDCPIWLSCYPWAYNDIISFAMTTTPHFTQKCINGRFHKSTTF